MISIDDMMVFTKVVETQSFTKAGEALGIGKARVSQIVTKLEQALETRLLNRTTRSLSLTETGASYYAKCESIRDLALEANDEAKMVNTTPSGLIRISTSVGHAGFINLLSEFLKQYPQIELDIVESDSYSDLISSRFDLAIRASSALEDSSLYATPIGVIQDILCASPEYLAQFPAINTIEDLQPLDWISHHIVHGDKALRLESSQGKVTKLNKQPRVRVNTTQSIKQFMLKNLGFGIVPDYAVENELASGALKRILPEVHNLAIPIYAVYQNKALMPLRNRTLIDFLKQAYIAPPKVN